MMLSGVFRIRCTPLSQGWCRNFRTGSAHLIASNLEGQGTRLCVGEHHLQAFVELGALEESLEIAQSSQFSLLRAASKLMSICSSQSLTQMLNVTDQWANQP